MTPTTDSLAAHIPTDDEKTWALVAHISPMVALFLGPLLVLVVKGNESKWVRAHALESLNFSITLFIGYMISFGLTFVVIGMCMLPAMLAIGVVLHIIAGVKAFQGGTYRYPFALRLIND